jgi:hypothetical protein
MSGNNAAYFQKNKNEIKAKIGNNTGSANLKPNPKKHGVFKFT